jgi:hypothetical protein
MKPKVQAKDLVVLVADKNMEQIMHSLLKRTAALGIRQISYDLFVHPQRDPGCRQRAQIFLRPFCQQYEHALVFFDREGSGAESDSRDVLEQQVEGRLAKDGWNERAAVVVLDPELENWVWSDSPHVPRLLGWREQSLQLRDWLLAQGFLKEGEDKPIRPKEAVEAVLKQVRKPRSSAIYGELASTVSFRHCVDPAFAKLRSLLEQWFNR